MLGIRSRSVMFEPAAPNASSFFVNCDDDRLSSELLTEIYSIWGWNWDVAMCQNTFIHAFQFQEEILRATNLDVEIVWSAANSYWLIQHKVDTPYTRIIMTIFHFTVFLLLLVLLDLVICTTITSLIFVLWYDGFRSSICISRALLIRRFNREFSTQRGRYGLISLSNQCYFL